MIIKEIRFGNRDENTHRLIYDKDHPKKGPLYKFQHKAWIGWSDIKKDGKKISFVLYPETVANLIKQYMKD